MREADLSVGGQAFAAMGIEELVALGREAGMRELEELTCHGTGAVVQVEVESRYDEGALSALSYVDSWTHVAELDEGHLYVIAFTAPDLPGDLSERADDLVGTCDPDVGEREATMSLVGPQETIAETIGAYESAGVSPDLRRLGSYRVDSRPLDELTDRQREVLRTAFEMGYYDVPRETSTDEIAAELDVDSSTVVEHLQRAERNLIGQFM